ncbi:MAG: BlaI/MecI/CopY family transcriptional regulator [Gemmatimonadaceae bacterium]
MAKDSVAGRLARLSRREREIMDVLYRCGRATVTDVMDALADPPSYSAVRATLNILVGKEQAIHRQDGPRYVYLPVIPADTARRAAITHVIDTFFGGSAEEAAVALLQMSDTTLPAGVVARLTREVQKARKEGR